MLKKILFSLILPTLVLIFKPLGLSLDQSIVLATLIFTITNWTTRAIKSIYVSILLLIIFMIFGNTPFERIFSFLLSDSFILILFSFIFSQGISNSLLAEKLFYPLISKYVKNVYQLLIAILLSAFILIFVIPQPMSRVIMLSFIFNEYFNKIGIKGNLKEILMFSTMAFSTFLQSIFKRADLLLSTSALSLADISMTEGEWARYMTVPSILMVILGVSLFILVYRKDLREFDSSILSKEQSEISLDKKDKKNLLLIGLVVILWATEGIHHISGSIIVVIGTILMYFKGLVVKKDLKTVNITLLVFLTAVMSIGAVMKGSGIAEIVFGSFTGIFPKEFSAFYIFIVIITTMSLHMILGSNLTSMSVVIPGIMTITTGIVDPTILMFLVFVSLFSHYLLSVHSTIFAMGVGYGYFSSKTVTRFGLVTTPFVFISIYCFFIPWWKLIGVL